MAVLEIAAFILAKAVGKTACGVWFGDSALAEKAGEEVVDAVAGKLVSPKDQRRFRNVWNQAAEIVADRLEPMIETEVPDLADHEKLATMQAVTDTFEVARLTDDDLFRHDLDAGYLD